MHAKNKQDKKIPGEFDLFTLCKYILAQNIFAIVKN